MRREVLKGIDKIRESWYNSAELYMYLHIAHWQHISNIDIALKWILSCSCSQNKEYIKVYCITR